MLAIVGRRDSGKTTILVRHAAEAGAVIVCRNRTCVEVCKRTARRLALTIPEPVTFHEALYESKLKGLDVRAVIDDLEFFLAELMCRPCTAVALTGDAVVMWPEKPTLVDGISVPIERTRAIEKAP